MSYSILIVEDQQTILQILASMLSDEELDYSIISATNGKEACQLAIEKQPDLILMDWMMPVMSGLEAVKKLKSMQETKDIPVLMITWHKELEKLHEAFEAGSADYITKPIEKIELLARINSVLNESNYKKEILKQKEELLKEKEKVDHYAAELERSNNDLKEFASIVSHDLKEPLRKILYSGDKLKSQNGKVENEHTEKIISTANRMNTLIHDLLAYSKVNTSGSSFEKVNLNDIVNGVISDLEVRINETKGEINADDLPTIEADKMQMHQLFQNLIGNALKFHRGAISPVVTITSKSTKKGYEIKVSDNGIGFDEKYLDRIFNPFQRLHSKNEYEGTGMGTAICKKIVERHKGSLTANSEVNKGSTFIIKLPEIRGE